EPLEQQCAHHALAGVADRGGIVVHGVRGGPDEAANEGQELRLEGGNVLIERMRVVLLRDRLTYALHMGTQVRLAVRTVDQRRDRHRPFTVPESVKDLRQVPDYGTGRSDVEVAE